jgi:hypothetical protein
MYPAHADLSNVTSFEKPYHRSASKLKAPLITHLLLEISNGIVVGIRKEIVHVLILLLNMLLKVVHQVSTIPFDLVSARHSTKHDLDEFPVGEWSIRDTSNDFVPMLDHGETTRVAVHDQSGDILSRHFRELPLKEVLEASEDYIRPFLPVILDRCELDPSLPLLGYDDFLFLRELCTE